MCKEAEPVPASGLTVSQLAPGTTAAVHCGEPPVKVRETSVAALRKALATARGTGGGGTGMGAGGSGRDGESGGRAAEGIGHGEGDGRGGYRHGDGRGGGRRQGHIERGGHGGADFADSAAGVEIRAQGSGAT